MVSITENAIQVSFQNVSEEQRYAFIESDERTNSLMVIQMTHITTLNMIGFSANPLLKRANHLIAAVVRLGNGVPLCVAAYGSPISTALMISGSSSVKEACVRQKGNGRGERNEETE